MNILYQKWWSSNLGREMELKVYGYYGKPVLVFPTLGGRFFEYEDYGMVNSIGDFIESGKIKLFTVDSIDHESWANGNLEPAHRALKHESYDKYITQEVVPFIKSNCSNTPEKILTTGCSMGAYHSANFFFRHPDSFDGMIAISGPLSFNYFIGDYSDETIYYNSPLNYLKNLSEDNYLNLYRQSKIILCAGQGAWEEPMLHDAELLRSILSDKNIPHEIDIWGQDVNHDWPWWRVMMPYFLGKFFV